MLTDIKDRYKSCNHSERRGEYCEHCETGIPGLPEYEDKEDRKYLDWRWDNLQHLRTEFCSEHEDEFEEYCKKMYMEEE